MPQKRQIELKLSGFFSPKWRQESYSGMVADQLCGVGDLLAGVVVEDQEMDAIFPRSHLYVPHVPMLPPVPNMLTCTIRFHLYLYAMYLYALRKKYVYLVRLILLLQHFLSYK